MDTLKEKVLNELLAFPLKIYNIFKIELLIFFFFFLCINYTLANLNPDKTEYLISGRSAHRCWSFKFTQASWSSQLEVHSLVQTEPQTPHHQLINLWISVLRLMKRTCALQPIGLSQIRYLSITLLENIWVSIKVLPYSSTKNNLYL